MTRPLLILPAPVAGDVVLCRFPHDLRNPAPGPKARPGIILQAWEADAKTGLVRVVVTYGTSNRARLYPHEFEITGAAHPTEYVAAGIERDTKFSLRNIVDLDYTSEWFSPDPLTGKAVIGHLEHASIQRLRAARRAALA